jgi:hypothetical protein
VAKPLGQPIRISDDQWDALAGLGPEGFSQEQIIKAQEWGTDKLQELNAAREADDEPST